MRIGSVILVFALIDAGSLAAATISGFVRDSLTKETLVSATVSIAGTRLGARTNKSGFFTIKNVPAGRQTIVASYLGYVRSEITLELAADDQRRLTIDLAPGSITTREVTVQAERDEETREITVSRVDVPIEQLSEIRLGGESDVFRALQHLPGVLASSQISSGLYVRGGSPDQNLVLVDGAAVYNPSHLFGFYSAFNTDAIKDVELIKGGFPAEYGGRLSAVLNITQKEGNREQVEGLASIGLIASRAVIEGPIGNGSWFLGGRRTYLDLILELVPETEDPIPDFYFYDANARITQEIGDNDRVSLSGFLSRDHLVFAGTGLDFTMNLGNRTAALRWTHIAGSDLFTTLTASASEYSTGFTGGFSGTGFGVTNTITDYTTRFNAEWYATDLATVRAGFEVTNFRFNYLQEFFGPNDSANAGSAAAIPQADLTIPDWVYGGFAQLGYQLTERLAVQAGLRAEYLELRDELTFDPRFAVRFEASPAVSLKAAWGSYHQYLKLATLPDFSFFDTWLPTDSTVAPSSAMHYVLGVETKPFDGINIDVDLYYKSLENISEMNEFVTVSKKVSEIFFSGTGRSYGAELFVQKRSGDLTGWFGYGLGFIDVQFDSVNNGRTFRPKYDRRHDLKFVAQYRLNERWSFGGSFVFQSGQSYTGASSRFRATLPDDPSSGNVIVPAQRYGQRLPPSHQLNLNVNYHTTVFGLDTRVLLDVFNVYSRRDIWFRFYDARGSVTQVTDVLLLPIIPTISMEVRF